MQFDSQRTHDTEGRLTAELAQTLVANSVDVLFHTVDGVLEWISPSVSELLGWDADELVGGTTTHLWHPDDLPLAITLRDATYGGEPGRATLRFKRKDGVYIWIETSLRPFLETDGRTGAVGSLRDVGARVDALRQLTQSEANLRLISENSHSIAFRATPEGIIEWVSTSADEILEIPREHLIGARVLDFVDPGDADSLTSDYSALLNDGAGVSRARFMTGSGASLWMEARVRVVSNDAKEVIALVGTLHDVNAQVIAEQQLRASELHYRLLADNASDIVYLAGADRLIQWVSAAVTETLGWTPEELVGTRMSTILHPVDRETQRETRDDLYAGATIESPPEGHVVRMRTKEGDYHWLSGRSHIVTNESGAFIGVVTGMRNVDALIQARAEALESAERFRLLAENISEVVLRTRDGVVTWVSQSITQVLGWNPDAFIGSSFLELIHPEDHIQFESVLVAQATEQAQLTDKVWITRVRLRHANGQHRWAEIRTSHFVDSQGKYDGGIATFHLIDDQINFEQELERRATHDHLTGMLNRDELMVRLRMADEAPRTPGDIRAVIFCDIDNFKTINDADGHQVGDEVLVRLAERIRSALRSSDLVARMGGDEFVIVLEGIHGLDEAEAIAQKVRRAAETPVVTSSRSITTSLSLGVTIRAAGEDVESVIGRADRALYEAKRAGRNRVVAVPAP